MLVAYEEGPLLLVLNVEIVVDGDLVVLPWVRLGELLHKLLVLLCGGLVAREKVQHNFDLDGNIPFNIANILFYFNPYLNNWIISARFNKSQIWKILPGLEFEILDRAVGNNFVTWTNLDEIFHLSFYTLGFWTRVCVNNLSRSQIWYKKGLNVKTKIQMKNEYIKSIQYLKYWVLIILCPVFILCSVWNLDTI